MIITVIPSDRWIRQDTISANLPEWPFDDGHIHAIQWDGSSGEIEYEGKPKPQNEQFTDSSLLDPYISALNAYTALADSSTQLE